MRVTNLAPAARLPVGYAVVGEWKANALEAVAGHRVLT